MKILGFVFFIKYRFLTPRFAFVYGLVVDFSLVKNMGNPWKIEFYGWAGGGGQEMVKKLDAAK